MTLNVSTCIGCLQSDDHPKHRIGAADGTEVAWHFDCHGTTGCESCIAQKEGAEHLRGDEFREHIVGLGDEFHAALQATVNEQHQLDAGVHPSQLQEGE